MVEIEYTRRAIKGLRKMPKANATALRGKIEAYAADPSASHPCAQPLTGRSGVRLRDGGFRAIVELRKGEVRVLAVIDAGPRGSVYS